MHLIKRYASFARDFFIYLFNYGNFIVINYLDPVATRKSLAVGYMLFDGEEIVLDSIIKVRPVAERIYIVFQTTDNWGLPHPRGINEIRNFWSEVKRIGLVDEIVEYCPSRAPATDYRSHQEVHDVAKRNLALELAKKDNIDLYMCIDNDEIYLTKQLRYMKFTMSRKRNREKVAAVQHLQYFKDNKHIKVPIEQEYVATIFWISEDSQFVYDYPLSIPIDPARRPNINKIRRFRRFEIEMHHMSYVRDDIRIKLKSSAMRNEFHQINEKISELWDAFPSVDRVLWASNWVTTKKVRKVIPLPFFSSGKVKSWIAQGKLPRHDPLFDIEIH